MAGKKGRSGRPSNKTYEHLEDLLSKAWSAGSRLAAVRKLAEMAEAGEVKAAQLLLAYAYGKPVERHEVTGAGGGPLTFAEIAQNVVRRRADRKS